MKHWNVAAYIRLSKEDGDNIESNSITNQKDIIKQFVDNCPDMTVAEFYIDDGYSGTNFDRPAIKKLMDDIVDEKVNAVIVKDLSRLGRNHIYVDFLLEEIFPKHKIRFISILDKFDSNERNILIPSEYKKKDKLNENLERKKLNNDRVTEILKNRVYIGEITQEKKKSESYRSHKLVNVDKENWIITKNHHEPLVSKEDSNKVQELLKRQGTKVDENGNVDLFYGYLICNECGTTLRKSQKYYYCNTYSRTRKCSKHSTNREKLIDYVIKDINKKVEKYKNLTEFSTQTIENTEILILRFLHIFINLEKYV